MLKGWAVNDPKYKEANITIIKSCKEDDPCFLFNMLGPQGADIGDTWAGVILLLISLVMLCSCLMGMVKLLNSLLGEKVREAIKEGVNKDIPIQGLAWLTGYLAMLVGDTITTTITITIPITILRLAPFSPSSSSRARFSPPPSLLSPGLDSSLFNGLIHSRSDQI